MRKVSLDQMLATIPPQSQRTLDEKIDDIHLAVIASALIDWELACIILKISEAEEVAIEEDSKTVDTRRYFQLLCPFAKIKHDVLNVFAVFDCRV